MHTDEFSYDLPERLIAQEPLAQRDSCRLLHINRQSQTINHNRFTDILDILKPGDRLVLNNTRVIPARLSFRKSTGAALEVFFTERIDSLHWKALLKPARKVPPGSEMELEADPGVKVRVEEIYPGGERKLFLLRGSDSFEEIIDEYGSIPLPHYIERESTREDREQYQTVFARVSGAVAAPTAGLHFTESLLESVKKKGVDISFVTLHVGIGTFRPVKVSDPRKHDIHQERYELSGQAADEINGTWEKGGRVVAIGTTVTRVLEHCAVEFHRVEPSSGETKLMILPPYEFRAVDVLLTNFHLPRSTLLMLVSALASKELILKAYREAVNQEYRFFSYGDAMIIT
ncbi:S-adenosylmethionine:tRNA ribosyltransferase-isomerase [Chitinispirillum alkaliphilum]|nr:S-adenosylmethionine:tRNA ribosyltransferase-isomerase [Chitinispirillum alkaliphilum]